MDDEVDHLAWGASVLRTLGEKIVGEDLDALFFRRAGEALLKPKGRGFNLAGVFSDGVHVETKFPELLLGQVQEGVVAKERCESRSPGGHVGVLFVWRGRESAPPGDGVPQRSFWVGLMALVEFFEGVRAAIHDPCIVVGVKKLV